MNVKLAMFLVEYYNTAAKMNSVVVVFVALVLTGTIDTARADCKHSHCNGTLYPAGLPIAIDENAPPSCNCISYTLNDRLDYSDIHLVILTIIM